MDLQLFAVDETGDNSGGSGSEGETGADVPAKQNKAEDAGQPTFDDLLKGGHQEEYNRRVREAVSTALTKAQEKWQALADDRLSEAEKLARMTKEEKAEYQRQKKEKELAEKEAVLTKRELMAEAKNTLAEKKIPVGLAELLIYTDADTCRKSMETMEAAWKEAVEAGVKDQLKGGPPPRKAPTGGGFTKEQVAAMSPEEINENWDSISQSMATWGK